MTSPRFAISSIGWHPEEVDEVLPLLQAEGITGIEIAPTSIWADPTSVGREDADRASERWHGFGLTVVALQALLYGRPDLELFGDADARRRTIAHLTKLCRLSELLGGPVLIFGSPRNRRTQGRPAAEVERIASRFFSTAGRIAQDHGTSICIEPNPPMYGTDFVTSTQEAWRFVQHVGQPGFGLHLDAGALVLEGADSDKSLLSYVANARHFHISEPGLVEFGSIESDHSWIASALRRADYSRWRSIEMAATAGENPARIHRAIQAARGIYG